MAPCSQSKGKYHATDKAYGLLCLRCGVLPSGDGRQKAQEWNSDRLELKDEVETTLNHSGTAVNSSLPLRSLESVSMCSGEGVKDGRNLLALLAGEVQS